MQHTHLIDAFGNTYLSSSEKPLVAAVCTTPVGCTQHGDSCWESGAQRSPGEPDNRLHARSQATFSTALLDIASENVH